MMKHESKVPMECLYKNYMYLWYCVPDTPLNGILFCEGYERADNQSARI